MPCKCANNFAKSNYKKCNSIKRKTVGKTFVKMLGSAHCGHENSRESN